MAEISAIQRAAIERRPEFILMEGTLLKNFSARTLSIVFNAERTKVIFLTASYPVTIQRIMQRRAAKGGKSPELKPSNTFKKWKETWATAKLYASIGVPMLRVDTDHLSPHEVFLTSLPFLF